MEGTGNHLLYWIVVSLWSNRFCSSGFSRFRLVPRFQVYLISLDPCRITSSSGAFLFIHSLIPACIFSFSASSIGDTEIINCHLGLMQSHYCKWNISGGHMIPRALTTRPLHQADVIYWKSFEMYLALSWLFYLLICSVRTIWVSFTWLLIYSMYSSAYVVVNESTHGEWWPWGREGEGVDGVKSHSCSEWGGIIPADSRHDPRRSTVKGKGS